MAKKQILSGCLSGPGPNGEIITSFNGTVQPLTFLGGTVIGFNANLGIGPTEESSLDIELVNDCFASGTDIPENDRGSYFLGESHIGSPVFFDLCEPMGVNPSTCPDPDKAPCFRFGGILQSYTAKQSAGGLTFNARVVDPRSLLTGVTIVTGNTLTGPVKHRNYYNVYAYYEQSLLDKESRYTASPKDLLINGGNQPQVTDLNRNNLDKKLIQSELPGDDLFSDCSVFGTSTSDSRGMLVRKVVEALYLMNDVVPQFGPDGKGPLVYSPNYAETFSPPLQGPDGVSAAAKNILKHQNNVFKLDLSELILDKDGKPIIPQYLRVPGPSLSLMELITTICESTGHDFIVTLEKAPGAGFHTIKVRLKKVADKIESFKSAILDYNGRAVDLTYGKELRTDAKTRTILVGEQKHEIVESCDIEMFFGEDKYGNPILPQRDNSKCGFYIDLYLDELQHSLYCPLFDPDTNTIIDLEQKWSIDEFTLRTALTSFELWKKYIFNPVVNQEFARLIQHNFPEAVDEARTRLLQTLARDTDSNKPANQRPDFIPPAGNANPEAKAVADAISVGNNAGAEILEQKRNESIKKVYDFISNIARTYYGRQYVASINKNLCAQVEGLDDSEYLGRDSLGNPIPIAPSKKNNGFSTWKDPCTGNEVEVADKIYKPFIYSHIPTNEGGWVDPCTSVLGLGLKKNPDTGAIEKDLIEIQYLDFFKTEDGRVEPFARIVNKGIVVLNDVSQLYDGNPSSSGIVSYVMDLPENIDGNDGAEIDAWFSTQVAELSADQNSLFFSSICGALDISQLSADQYVAIRKTPFCEPPLIENGKPKPRPIEDLRLIDMPGSIYVKCSVSDKIYPEPQDPEKCGSALVWPMYAIEDPLRIFDIVAMYASGVAVDPTLSVIDQTAWAKECCEGFQNKDKTKDCYLNTSDLEIYRFNSDPRFKCTREIQVGDPESRAAPSCAKVRIPFSFSSPLYRKPCDTDSEDAQWPASVEAVLLNYGENGVLNDPMGTGFVAEATVTNGSISAINITNPGYGYRETNPKPIVMIYQSGHTADKATAEAVVGGNGEITDITISFSGAGYNGDIPVVVTVSDNPNDEVGLEGYDRVQKFKASRINCQSVKPTAITVARAALDAAQINNTSRLVPTASIPDMVAIPVKSNIEAYGPWYSSNFQTSSGGVEFKQDSDLSPWTFGNYDAMDTYAAALVIEEQINLTEIETGSINVPYWPEISLGFLDNGPNLTRVNVSIGSNGVSTTYSFQSYTPQFAKVKALEKQSIVDGAKNRNRLLKLGRDKNRQLDILNRKVVGPGNTNVVGIRKPSLDEGGTLHRVMVGQSYPLLALSEITSSGTYDIVGTGDRTVVGTETLEKSILELRYDYNKKAFMSLDGFYSPISISGDGGFPRYAAYSGFDSSAKSIYVSPNPPVEYSGAIINDLSINRHFTNPLTNPFGSGDHHHIGYGAGHVIDIVGRESGVPESGMIMNFYGQSNWDARYSDDYRFLGLKGPLVLHAWGYDTQGKPVPNLADDISNSTIGDFKGSGLQDYFLTDWLHKPSTWPVAPIDLRFDRQRGVWVSPPQHKIVVVQASGSISPYETGVGYLINQRENRKYSIDIYDSEGKVIAAEDETDNLPQIIIEDRIGKPTTPGQKHYAYFDSFTSTYLLMGAADSSIKIGKFCNQWPSLSNVKDPANAVKKVVLYEPAENCDSISPSITSCPWLLQPVMVNISGVEVPKVIEAMNIFSNVAAAEYQTKWCAVSQIGNYYYLLAAEC